MQQIVENSADGIIILNLDGVIQLVNPAAEKLFNRAASELAGSVFGFPLVFGEFSEIELVAADGHLVTVELRVAHTEWKGQPALLASLRDITERKRVTQELKQAKLFNEAILNSLSSHIAVVNSMGVIVAVNQAWEAFARDNGDPMLAATGVGISYFEVCRRAAGQEASAVRALEGMLAVLRGQQSVFELEYPCHSPDSPRWFLMRVTPFAGDGDLGLVVTHMDITERKQSARQQAETEIQAEHQQHELTSLEAIAQPLGAQPNEDSDATLRTRMPDRFDELAERCAKLLDKAVQQRAFETQNVVSDDLRALAEYLGLHKAGPRDVMEIYLMALRTRMNNASVQKSVAYVEEGRILVLELMGYLAGFYRNYLPPVIRNPVV